MVASISRRLRNIKKLVRNYYDLEYGELIEKHTELLRIFTIRGSKHNDHPHKMMRVYISRRALKHFVESRKKELSLKHTEKETLDNICFAIDTLPETIINFTGYELIPPKHFYIKDYSHFGKPHLRILVEPKDYGLEICSIHFTKHKRK
jgi:hypothetical protein